VDRWACDERVGLDERHVNEETLAIADTVRATVLKGWVELPCQAKQLNGEKRYGMTKHRCPACGAKK